tara:strand:+ start:82 stop:819 length:738 start_codon:yes stop_codon:yes gene_type:complete
MTGGAGGIGSSTVVKLISGNVNIAVIDNDSTKIKKLKNIIPKKYIDKVIFFKCDISSYKSVKKTIEQINKRFNTIDVLINCAAILNDVPLLSIYEGKLKKMSLNSWQQTIDTNLNSYFYCTREVVEKMVMKRTRGIIINISSISSSGNLGQSSYAASKAAVNALTVTWAQELSAFGIRVAGLAPGMTDTPMPKDAMQKTQLDNWINKAPLKRMADPSEIADGINFIINNNYYCGRTLELDGGLRM